MSNKSKVVKGGLFLAMSNVTSQVLSVIVNIVLARILVPEDFGVFALANASIGFIAVITSVGFGSAIINNHNATQKQISTLYWLNFITASITYVLVYISAHYFELFYESKGLAQIIRFSGISILITPFFITHLKILERDLELSKTSSVVILSSILSSALSIITAYLGLGLFALVVQSVSMSLFKLIFTKMYSKWKCSFEFDLNASLGMIWFALKHRTAQAIQFFERNVDYFILGKLLNNVVLGYYSFAFNIMYMPVKRISDLFRDVLFPTFSKIKDNKDLLLQGYFKSLRIVMMVSFPIMFVVSFNSRLIIEFVFGDKWIEAASIVSILSIGGAFQSITQFGDIIFTSLGHPEKTIYISISRIVGTILSIVIGINFGIIGVSYCLTFSKVLSFVFILYLIKKQIYFPLSILFKHLKGNLIAIIYLVLLEGIYYLLNFNDSWLKLFFSALTVSLLMMYLNKLLLIELISALRKKV